MSNDKAEATFYGGGAPLSPQELKDKTAFLILPETGGEELPQFGPSSTGAFVARAAALGESSSPAAHRGLRWHEVSLTLLSLYGLFIGLPAVAGAWAAFKIWSSIHG